MADTAPSHDAHTISTRATVTRKKSRVKGTQVTSWQLALIIIGSIGIFFLLTLLSVGIIRWRRVKQVQPDTDEESQEVREQEPGGIKASQESNVEGRDLHAGSEPKHVDIGDQCRGDEKL